MTLTTGDGAFTATLEPSRMRVEPGGSASCELHIRGLVGSLENLRFEVVGVAAGWSWVVPPTGPGPTGDDLVARVVARPPRGAGAPAGEHQVGVRVRISGGDPREALAEGVVVIGAFAEVSAALRPPVAEGRSSTTHDLDITVHANTAVNLSIAPVTNEALDLQVSHSALAGTQTESHGTRILVRPRRRLLRGTAIEHPFAVTVTADGGDPVTASGQMRQLPVMTGPAIPAVIVVALLVVAALVVAGTVLPQRGSSSEANKAAPAATDALATGGCPADGHRDTFVSGLTPERIPTLPASYSFSFVKADGCSPVRFDPCQPVHYVLNPAQAPPTGVSDVHEAFNRLSRATGIDFVDDGMTDETSRRGPAVTDRYPGRWAPILVVWTHQAGGRGNIEVVGSGFPDRVGDVLVSGTLTLNSDAVNNVARNTPVPGGFGSGGGSGVGAIGAEGVTWGRVILHELAHIMGLGHTRDRDQLMYPDTAEQTSHTTDYRSGDREGLRLLGRAAGCVADPPPPA